MSLTSTKKIVLDFYNKNIVTVNAKQNDSQSRYLNIACTDNSKKIFLDKMYAAAFVRYTKNDGNKVFNKADILEDGTILVELTEQMLAVVGKHEVEIVLTSLSDKTINEPSEDINIFYENGCKIISTMTFYLNVMPIMADVSAITSTEEYTSLSNALTSLTYLSQVEGAVNTANSKAELADTAAKAANEAASEAEKQINLVNTATASANNAATNASNAANTANNAAQACQNMINNKELARLEDGKIPSFQINYNSLSSVVKNSLDQKTGGLFVLDAYQGYVLKSLVDAMPKIRYNNIVDDSIGNDGDILLVPISENSGESTVE